MENLRFDVVVVGGSIGGVMAAYHLSKRGNKVLLIEQTDWIGGQLTSQGVPSDEHIYIEETGATKTYYQFREWARDHYRNDPSIKDVYKTKKIFNPGEGWVSKNSFLPKIALQLFYKMLTPFLINETLTIFTNTHLVSSDSNNKVVNTVTIKKDEKKYKVFGKYFIDGTDNGDLLPITKTEYVTGAEPYNLYQEPHAPKEGNKDDLQPITWVAAVRFDPNNQETIEKPVMYEFFRHYQMPFGTPLLDWYQSGLEQDSKRLYSMFGKKNKTIEELPPLFSYRQIYDPKKFKDVENSYPVTLLNWPHNDYIFGNIIDNKDKEFHLFAAKQQTLSLIYWLQTEAKRDDDKGYGYPEIKIADDIFDTEDGLAKAPYIRESRRIKALYTIIEQDISKKYASKLPKFWDSIGIGKYQIDLHMTTKTKTYFFDEALPFEIPLGSLIPINKTNLIAACKNIGTTHITNGCYRLHPVEWNIGESAGIFIDYCLKNNLTPHKVYNDKKLVKAYQYELIKEGIMLSWPTDILKEEQK